MSVAEILTFSLVASLLVMSPGSNGALIAKTVPMSGRRAGFANVAGFVTAFYIHGTLSVLGISILITQSATAFAIAKYSGVFGLDRDQGVDFCLTQQLVTNPNSRRPEPPILVCRLHRGLVDKCTQSEGFHVLSCGFSQFVSAGDASAVSSFVLVAIHSLLNAIRFGVMVLLLGKVTGWTQRPRAQKLLKHTVGAVFIFFGAKLASLNRV